MNVLAPLILFLIFFGMPIGAAIYGEWSGARAVMQQAYERGHAVQCPGKTGYHWECAEGHTNER